MISLVLGGVPVGQEWEVMVSLSPYKENQQASSGRSCNISRSAVGDHGVSLILREVSVRSLAIGRGVSLILGGLSVGQRGRSWSLSHISKRCGRSAERSLGISFIWSWEE
jgi:hypothetical protein